MSKKMVTRSAYKIKIKKIDVARKLQNAQEENRQVPMWR
jgi:hypothetical protein